MILGFIMKKISAFILAFSILFFQLSAFSQMNKDYDLVIKNARIVDGTGNPWFYGDIAVKNGRIEQIGKVDESRGKRIIDVKNQIVAPGFIDVHGHIEGGIEDNPLAENMLQMGVTSIITGNCGFSETSLKDWFVKLEKMGISMNVGSLVGHNAVRKKGMNGDFDRPPSAEEIRALRGRKRDEKV